MRRGENSPWRTVPIWGSNSLRHCQNCGAPFAFKLYKVKQRNTGKYCSEKCGRTKNQWSNP